MTIENEQSSVQNTKQTGTSWNCKTLENIRLGHYYEGYLDIHNRCYGVLGLDINEKSYI